MRAFDEERTLDVGTAGGSAQREYERRRTKREQRMRERHPRLGGLLLALRDAPQHERAWADGARGERAVARALAKRCHPRVVLLHDRRVPGTRANIDHIAIARSGVWVIDSKDHAGKVTVTAPRFGQARLKIAGRDQTHLVAALARQVELVAAATVDIDTRIPVHGVLCFVEAELPLLRGVRFDRYSLLYPRALAKRISAPGDVSDEGVRAVAIELARRFPAA